jgi:hypothetical protein
MKTKLGCRWRRFPEKHDYPAAESYLRLIFPKPIAAKFVKKLKNAPVHEFKSKDIFRASALPLLPPENFHVRADLRKIERGEKISPLLLVRQPELGKVIIADGYHRMCAVYSLNEDAMIRCQIV